MRALMRDVLLASLITIVPFGVQAAVLLGPSPYLSSADSPFTALTGFNYFHLEDFEDGLMNTPGVSADAAAFVGTPNPAADSVDADDGSIDGSGIDGHSLASPNGSSGLTITFDAVTLGLLPTHVGIVFTDGADAPLDVIFEAFDGLGSSLGVVTLVGGGDASFFGTTAEDRFMGIISDVGVGSIRVSQPTSPNFVELDHLQYGFMASATVPIPGTLTLALFGLAVIRRFGALDA